MNLESKIKQMILEKSAVVEMLQWEDETGDNYAFLMFDGKDYNKYQAEIKSGELTLEDWGVFFKGKGKPSKSELLALKELYGEENFKINIEG
jgi:hypothetical protein